MGELPGNGLCEEKKRQKHQRKDLGRVGRNMSRQQALDTGKEANYLKSTKMYVQVAEGGSRS